MAKSRSSADRPRKRSGGGGGGTAQKNRGGGGGGGGGRSGGNRGKNRQRKKKRGNRGGNPNRNGAPQADNEPVDPSLLEPVVGILEVLPDGFGFLRAKENEYQPDGEDVFVSTHIIRQHQLREGSFIRGYAAPGRNRSKGLQLKEIVEADGATPEEYARREPFQRLTCIDPIERLRIDETGDISMRILDLVAPIGKGQRGLIVAPPRTGKTVLLQKLALAVQQVHPECHLMIVLIDERPEEVTDMRRSTGAEVIASSNDEMTRKHVRVAEIVLERARRMVEAGEDVVILLDSLTRMARAYNVEQRGSGRTLSGGLDAKTMQKPREFFGAARKCEEGGSLTIIATALIDTGSRMDQVIFEEFKGTGNMELVLHRPLAEKRVWPAIDIHKSGTRKEEKMRTEEVQEQVNLLRRILADRKVEGAMEALVSKIEKTESNAEFLSLLNTVRDR